jgi:hypothetical protein
MHAQAFRVHVKGMCHCFILKVPGAGFITITRDKDCNVAYVEAWYQLDVEPPHKYMAIYENSIFHNCRNFVVWILSITVPMVSLFSAGQKSCRHRLACWEVMIYSLGVPIGCLLTWVGFGLL